MIILKNKGEIELDLIKTMGVNIKESDSPIGYFGTGLKYAIAVFLRERIDVKAFIGEKEYYFYIEPKTIRGKQFEICSMRGPYDSVELGFTTELGKNWEVWQAYREIHSNCLDEGGHIQRGQPSPQVGYTTFVIDIDLDISKIFLEDKELIWGDHRVEIFKGASDVIYYKGIRAKDLDRPSMYTYNLIEDCTLTEDRLIAYDWRIEEIISDSIAEMDNRDVIKNVVTAKNDYYEHGLRMGYNSRVAPKEDFLVVAHENKNQLRSGAADYVAKHKPSRPMTLKERTEKIISELMEICEGYDLDVSVNDQQIIITGDSLDL